MTNGETRWKLRFPLWFCCSTWMFHRPFWVMKAQSSCEIKALLCRWLVYNARKHKSCNGFNFVFMRNYTEWWNKSTKSKYKNVLNTFSNHHDFKQFVFYPSSLRSIILKLFYRQHESNTNMQLQTSSKSSKCTNMEEGQMASCRGPRPSSCTCWLAAGWAVAKIDHIHHECKWAAWFDISNKPVSVYQWIQPINHVSNQCVVSLS